MRSRLFLSALVLAITACEGDVGPVGPQGPEGPQGPQGPQGNVNVTSGTFTVAPVQYTNGFWYFIVDGGTQGNPAKVATVAVPGIPSALVTDGAVLVYLRVPATSTQPASQWSLLPFHQGGFGGGYLVSIKAAVDVGAIRIGYVHEATGAATPPDVYAAALPTYEFRWVGIHGMPSASVAALALLGSPDAVIAALR